MAINSLMKKDLEFWISIEKVKKNTVKKYGEIEST